MQLFAEDELAQPSSLSANNARLLTALADIGCGKHALAAFLALDNAHADHIRFLTGPIVQHRSPWADTTPDWLYEAVTADRLQIILAEHERRQTGWQVGPVELTAVMYPATMDAPLSLEYADIYLWASAQANARHRGKEAADIWAALGIDPIEDRLIVSPAGRYHQAYRQLCTDIRRRVVKAAARTAGTSPQEPDEKPIGETAVITEQLPLF